MSNELQFRAPKPTAFRLAPGASVNVDGPGTFARIIEATGSLKIGFDLGTTFATNLGFAYGTQTGQKFFRVTIENPSAVDTVTGTIVTGDLTIYDDRLHVITDQTNGIALDGTDCTAPVMPAGGVGIRGWLSAIFDAVSGGTINITGTGIATEVTLDALATAFDAYAADFAAKQVGGTLNGGIADLAPVATGGANATQLIAASTKALRKGVKVVNTGTVPLRIAGTDANAKAGGKGDYLFVGSSVFYPIAGALYAAGVGGVGACAVSEELW